MTAMVTKRALLVLATLLALSSAPAGYAKTPWVLWSKVTPTTPEAVRRFGRDDAWTSHSRHETRAQCEERLTQIMRVSEDALKGKELGMIARCLLAGVDPK